MAGQYADPVREFAEYLRDLVGRIDQDGGWCGVFMRRDPQGMRACLQGREVPPWDVVEALLNDLATAYGRDSAAQELDPARALHERVLRHVDTRPGARERLGERLGLMRKEQQYAAERHAELGELLLTASPFEAEQLRLDLAWAQDDHERAASRVAELQDRLHRIASRSRTGARDVPQGSGDFFAPRRPRTDEEPHGTSAATGRTPGAPADGPGDAPPDGAGRTPGSGTRGTSGRGAARKDAAKGAPGGESRTRGMPFARGFARRGGRSAQGGGPDDTGADPQTTARGGGRTPAPTPTPGRETPRGAHHTPVAEPTAPPGTAPGPEARTTAATVASLIALRGSGRTGEAHVLLCEAARRPPEELPLLAGELQRAGLAADWATLLWEAASLPPAELVAVAEALAAAGRGEDARQLLRQGVGRPAAEIGEAALVMADAGRRLQAEVLLEAFLRVRTPEEAARIAAADPDRLIPPLLKAAKTVSGDCRRDLKHALRVAGFDV